MGISPLPPGFTPGQRFGSNPTRALGPGDELFDLFGNYQPNGHTGDDYPAPTGTPVYATADGVVMWAGPGEELPGDDSNEGWAARWFLDRRHVGNLVAVEHDRYGGYTTLAYHLDDVAVAPFDRVTKGQLVGHVGSTGRSTGSHLHLDVVPHAYEWGNGMWGRVDPAPYTSERGSGDMIWLTDLADQLRARGLTVVEVPGWKTRGYAGWGLYGVRGVLHHHTATGRAAFASSNMPTLNLLVNGRSDLPGPLCNLGFGRDGTVYVIAAGWANHAGRGHAAGIPADSGNGWLVGIEAESSGVPPYDWTPDQLRVWPYLGAAIEAAYLMALPPDMRLQLGHREYSSEGKIDPAGVSMDELRASINRVLDGKTVGTQSTAPAPAPVPREWDEMATKAEIEAAVRAVLREEFDKAAPKKGRTSLVKEAAYVATNQQQLLDRLDRVLKALDTIAAAVTPSRLALAVWGYKGKSARTDGNGVALDAYATLNGVHRQVHEPEQASTASAEAAPSSGSKVVGFTLPEGKRGAVLGTAYVSVTPRPEGGAR